MAKALHALDYLENPEKHPVRPVCVLFGDEQFLKRQVLRQLRENVLGSGEGEFSLSEFEGRTALLGDVLDELATMPMFGGNRLVVVEEAEEFVKRYRERLEHYVAEPKAGGVLVLVLKSWPAGTRIYKAVAAEGLPVDCSSPKPDRLARWVSSWAGQSHGFQLPRAAAKMLIEMVGPELGLLDRELSKLALTAGRGGKVSDQMVQQVVGGWRAKTTWEMLDAVLSGDACSGLLQLDRLLLAGESPVAVLGQISASLRRFAAATRLFLQAEARGRRLGLSDALRQAGFKPFLLGKAEGQLRHLGRHRGAELYGWLLEADLDLKGGSPLPPRLILERLILRLAAPAANRPSGRTQQ